MSEDRLLLRLAAEDFLYAEAALLDGWQLEAWLALLTDDCAYYVPPTDKPDSDHRTTLFLVADDAIRLRERVLRLNDPNCHAEYPPSRTRRLLGNVRLIEATPELVRTECSFITHRFRRGGDVRSFVGRHRHTLRRTAEGFRIAERWAILDAEELGQLGAVSFIL